MTQLVTDYDGLKNLKRALNRFSNIIKNSDLDECNVLKIVRKMLSCSGSLNQLLKSSEKYENFMDSVHSCNSSNHNHRHGGHHNKKTASDLFGIINSLKTSQNTVMEFYHEINNLLKALTSFYTGDNNISIPCDKIIRSYISDLYCCPTKINNDCCNDNDTDVVIYGIAMVVLIGLIFGGKSKCIECVPSNFDIVNCPPCDDDKHTYHHGRAPSNCSHVDNGNLCESPYSSDCDSDYDEKCHNKPIIINNKKCCSDPCDKHKASVYETSVIGLQYLLYLEEKDTLNKWCSIIGCDIGSIAKQLK